MPRATPQVSPAAEPETPHLPPQFAGQQYLSPNTNSAGSAQYGTLGYHYQHYPHGGGVDPFHTHPNDQFETARAGASQGNQPDPYAYPIPPLSAVESSAVGDGSRKRAVDASVAPPSSVKRGKVEEAPATTNTGSNAI